MTARAEPGAPGSWSTVNGQPQMSHEPQQPSEWTSNFVFVEWWYSMINFRAEAEAHSTFGTTTGVRMAGIRATAP
jgi:hypothetical protein